MAGEDTSKTTDLKQKLAARIDEARTKLDGLKADIAGLHEEDMQALELRRDQLRARIDEQKESAQKRQADFESWKQEKVAHTQEAIGSWRLRREMKKLEDRAERAEDYAIDAVSIAAYDFEEAEQALLDAIAARYDADSAAAGAP